MRSGVKKIVMYLILTKINAETKAAYTHWFDPENHFNEDVGMIVFNLSNHTFTVDGFTWNEIEEDHL